MRAKIRKKKNREVLSVSEQVLEALESSGNKQEWGIQPGCFFFPLTLLRMGSSFQQWGGSIPLGLPWLSPCCRMEILHPSSKVGSSCMSFVFLPSPLTPTFTPKPPGIFSFPDKPHQEITGMKDAGQIWKLPFKPQNEQREEITSQLLPLLPA